MDIPFTGMPQTKKEDPNPYHSYFVKRGMVAKKRKKTTLLGKPLEPRRILKRGWIEELDNG